MRRHRRGMRFLGLMFSLVGGLLFVAFLPGVFDPNSTIVSNGVRTNAWGDKLSAALFAAGFVAVGLFFLFAPRRVVDKMFVWRESVRYAIFPWWRQ
jgi:uncharacterized BrkB/YihY/UPF0761 family membrane protein